MTAFPLISMNYSKDRLLNGSVWNSKKAAVAGIIGNPMASAMEITERITIDGAGQPALVIGAKERIDNINNISVNTLAMNQLVCSTAGEIL